MRRALMGGVFVLCLCGLTGCGGGANYPQKMRQVLKDYAELTELCKKMKQDSAVDPMIPALQKVRSRLDTHCNELKALEPPSDPAKVRLQRKYAGPVLALRGGLARQEMRLRQMDKGKQLFLAGGPLSDLPVPLPVVRGFHVYVDPNLPKAP